MLLAVALIALAALAAVVPLVHRYLGRDTGWVLAVGFLALSVAFAVQAPSIMDGETLTAEWAWIPTLDVALRLRLDGLSLLFALVILGVGALVMAYSARYLSHGSHVSLYMLMTLFALAMLLLVLADDIVILFIAWELTTLCSFLLIGGARPAAAPQALRALMVTFGGGLALLAGLILLAVHTGTTRLSAILVFDEWTGDTGVAVTAGILVILGAMTKSAQLPFHFWLPDAMVAITPVSAYLHAASMVKAGIYLLMRFSPAFAESPLWTSVLIPVGLATAVVGALFALQQHDLKSLLAYSTVSQLGFLVALIGVGTPLALAAAALHTLAHALFKATLFMLVGIIDRQVGSRDIRELTGLWRVMPVTAILTGLAGLSMAGLPPFLGFVSKEEMFAAFHGFPGPGWIGVLLGALAVLAATLTFAYGLRIFYGAFGGPTVQWILRDPSPLFLAPAAAAAIVGLFLGAGVGWLSDLIARVAADTRLQPVELHLELLHGLSPEIAMSALTFILGTTLFLLRDRVDALLQRLVLPFNGIGVFTSAWNATVNAGARAAALTQRPSPAAQMPLPVLAFAAVAAAYLVWSPLVPPVLPGTTRGVDWIIVALLAATVVGAILQHSRLGAIILVGLAGFVVGLWFLLAGAPDLAITQVLFEVITVVVAVLVLRSLPRRFHEVRRVRRASAAALAILAGVGAGFATYALTGRRDRSDVAEHLLRESEAQTGGTNVVNTILVDFRGLDTLGEITVLVAAGLGVAALMDVTGRTAATRTAAVGRGDAVLIVDVVRRALTPVLAVLSLYLLLRGHNEPGGGFIAGLVAGCGIALLYLARPTSGRPPLRPIQKPLLAGGLLIAVGTGLAVMAAAEPFLRPLRTYVDVLGLQLSLTTSLVFDVGVYLVVIGTVAAAVNRLARFDTDEPLERDPAVAERGAT